jgi:hypothetical protein
MQPAGQRYPQSSEQLAKLLTGQPSAYLTDLQSIQFFTFLSGQPAEQSDELLSGQLGEQLAE